MLIGMGAAAAAEAQTVPAAPAAVSFYGNPSSPISAGVVIPPGAAFLWTSGTVPQVADAQARAGDRARFGDTRTRPRACCARLTSSWPRQGLSLRDVVYLRAYLVADPAKGPAIDIDGWSEAYKQFFGTAENPTRPARSTVGVSALVNPQWLIENRGLRRVSCREMS